MPIDDIFELVIYAHETASLGKFVNVFHLRGIDAVASTPITLLSDWTGNIQTPWRACLAGNVIIDRMTARTLIPFNTSYSEQVVNLAGSDTGNALPPNVAAILTWRTGLPGRRKRGRTYLGGINIAEYQGGNISASYSSTRLTPLANAILNTFGNAGTNTHFRLGVWSRLNAGPNPPFNLAGFQVVVSYTVQSALGAMGTRRIGRG